MKFIGIFGFLPLYQSPGCGKQVGKPLFLSENAVLTPLVQDMGICLLNVASFFYPHGSQYGEGSALQSRSI